MNNTVLKKTYAAPEFNLKEIYRYLGASKPSEEIAAVVKECISEADGCFTYDVCCTETNISITGNAIDFGLFSANSDKLAYTLRSCCKAVIFAATVGIGIDRLISRYSRISPVKSVCFQAIGAERIESLCDMFCSDLQREYENTGYTLKPRFSPGYGDLELSVQKDFFAVLDCHRKIGLTLSDSLLMIPSKSVTAVIGIEEGNR